MRPPHPPARKAPPAVLWDMDGTLVDTEPYWIENEYALVHEFGGTWSDEHARALIGNDLLTTGRYMQSHGPVPLPAEQIVDRLLDGVIERVRAHVPFMPGAWDLLAGLREQHVPCALVTMSYRRLAETVIAAVPAGSFAALVTGDEVVWGKPHPEPYLTAAARLGIPPEQCIAIEDSVTGVTSTRGAGVPTLAVQHLVPIPPAPGRVVTHSLVGWTPADLARLGEEALTAAEQPGVAEV